MKRIHGICLLVLLVLASCALPGAAWQIEIVDQFEEKAIRWGRWVVLVLDHTSRPHVVYHIRRIKVGPDMPMIISPPVSHYTFYNGRAWQIEYPSQHRRTAPLYGSRPSLVLDPEGVPVIAAGGDAVYYGRYVESSWHEVTINRDKGYYGYYFASLALAPDGQPHIAYLENISGTLKYASLEQSWAPETIDAGFETANPGVSGRGGSVSLALDRADRPHIGYCVEQSYYRCTLKYAYREGATWSIVEVDDNVYAARIFLVLDADDRPHLCYHAQDGLRYAYTDEAGWQIESFARVLGTLGGHAIALDPWGRPHVSYYDNGDLMYAWRDENGIWHKEAIDAVGDIGRLNALAVDAAGRVHVAYSDETNQSLKYARRIPGIQLLPAVVLAGVGLFLVTGGLVARRLLRRARKD